jgi:hypothetical protein
MDMDVNEHNRLSNVTVKTQIKGTVIFIAVLHLTVTVILNMFSMETFRSLI